MEATQTFINTPVPLDLERRIRITAAMLGVSKAEFMRRAALAALEQQNGKKNGKEVSNDKRS